MPLDNINVSIDDDFSGGGGSSESATVDVENPDSFADYSNYDMISLSVRQVTGQAGTYLTEDSAICEKNLVGENGKFLIVVNCYILQSQWVSGESNYALVHKDEFTIDEWIEKSTGEIYDEETDSWGSGGTTANGFEISFSMGDQSAPEAAGTLHIWFMLTAKVKDNTYRTAMQLYSVPVFEDEFVDDGTSLSIELKPVVVYYDTYATIGEMKTQICSHGDYYLVASSISSEEEASLHGEGEIEAEVRIDMVSGDIHLFIEGIEVYGALRNVYESFNGTPNNPQTGEVVLFRDYVPPVDGESNIEVLFPCYVEGNSDKIDKCIVAKLFGNANAKNRLFVSGNPDYPNCDWHSGAVSNPFDYKKDADSNGDFTYFGDMDYCFYGQTDNAIMGYDIVATDKMIVLKSKSKVEPTNYFRTSSLIQAIDAGGNAIKGVDGMGVYAEAFPLATGNVGFGAMNRNSIVNLNGDTLYLSSENTICGLNIAGQIGDSQRISYSRSRLIDPELKELDLSDAVLWTDNEFVYLFADEASYVSHYETMDQDTAQYEWFKIDVKGVRCAIDIDGYMYFGTKDGELFRFEKGHFSDCRKLYISDGGILANEGKITYNSALNPKIPDGLELTFKPKSDALEECIFRSVASIEDTSGPGVDVIVDSTRNTLEIVAIGSDGEFDGERMAVLVEELAYGGWFFLNEAYGSEDLAEPYAKFRLVPSDKAAPEYEVYAEDGSRADVTSLTEATLCRVLDEEYEIANLDKENSNFEIRENGRDVDLVLYSDQDPEVMSIAGEIHIHEPVKSYFIAAPATLGGVNYRKTVWAWTLSAFKEANDLQVCQATNEKNFDEMKSLAFADYVPVGLDLRNLTFLGIDFDKTVVPRKFTYLRPISAPFVSFGFRSTEDANSILTAVSITYSVPMLGWGSK